MHHTITLLSAQAHSCQQSNAFEVISKESVTCGFSSLGPECWGLMLLQSEHEKCVACQTVLLKYFHKWLKVCKIKDTWIIFVGGDCFTSNIVQQCVQGYICFFFPLAAVVHKWRGFLFLWIPLTSGLAGHDCASSLLPTHSPYHSHLCEHSEGIQILLMTTPNISS